MRLLGLVLVAAGALTLGAQALGGAGDASVVNVPVAGGIALVTGLLLLVGGGRRD